MERLVLCQVAGLGTHLELELDSPTFHTLRCGSWLVLMSVLLT